MITTKDLTPGFRFKDGDVIFTIHSISSDDIVTLSYIINENTRKLMAWVKLDLAVQIINDYSMTTLPRANNRLILNYTETL